ncbi:MAG: hypothetical protein RL260_1930 [Pseudomonadota bacterium]|jgi:hypothetical protein
MKSQCHDGSREDPETADQGQARWRAVRERREWLSGFDLQKLTAGYSKCEGVRIGSATVQLVCEEYATRRK